MNKRAIKKLSERVDQALNVNRLEIPLMVMQNCDDGKWYRFDSYGTGEDLVEVDLSDYQPHELHLMGCSGWTVDGKRIT